VFFDFGEVLLNSLLHLSAVFRDQSSLEKMLDFSCIALFRLEYVATVPRAEFGRGALFRAWGIVIVLFRSIFLNRKSRIYLAELALLLFDRIYHDS